MSGIISISNVVDKAWDLFKKNASNLIVILFIYSIVSGAASLVKSLFHENSVLFFITSIVETVVNLIMGLGLAKVLLNTVDGSEVKIGTLFDYRSPTLILHYVIGSIVMGIAIIAGLIFLIIPGFYIAARLQFFSFALLEQEEPDFMKALSSSWAMTENHVWDLVGLAVVAFLIIIAGLIALFVGLFVAIPVAGVMSAVAYRLLQTNELSA